MTALPEHCDLAVVGAGPAGRAAAEAATACGLATLLLDDRAPDLPRNVVWSVTPDLTVGVATPEGPALVQARRVILATGAMERPFPIPGWTLPGVMGAGGAQLLLKTAGLVAQGEVVLAGTGPLLYLLATQYLQAGVRIAALLDTTPRANLRAAAPHAPAFLASAYARRGWEMLRAARRLPYVSEVTDLRAEGDDRLRAIAWRRRCGPWQRRPADVLLLHQGVAPDLNLAAAAGCRLTWDDRQVSFRPEADGWGASSVAGLAVVGDGAGIAGREAAAPAGRLAALDAACRLGRIGVAERDRQAAAPRAALARALRGRAFIDALFRPARPFRLPADETIVCRCEEITAGQVRAAVAQGCPGPNQLKAFLRCGMGPCQGRLCGLTVTELMADAAGRAPAGIGYFRLRPPVRPLPLAALAALPATPAATRAVERH